MSAPSSPNPTSGSLPTGQVMTPETNVSATTTTAAFAQMTQIAAYVPPQVWTTEALLDLHQKQKEVAMRNFESLDSYRRHQNQLAWGGIALVAGIIGFGCYLIVIGNALGRDIIGSAVLFLAGYLAGQGKANLK
jgi:hypothetical protein